VLDDGRLTDGQGRTVDFRNAVIVMTSNLGSEIIQEFVEEGYEKMKAVVMEIVSQHFRPEFINRIDETVVFHALKQDQIRHIASIQIDLIKKRLKEKEYQLDVSKNALDYVAKMGYDPVYGARPLKRVLQQYLENPLAQSILEGKFLPGVTIKADKKGEQLEFVKG